MWNKSKLINKLNLNYDPRINISKTKEGLDFTYKKISVSRIFSSKYVNFVIDDKKKEIKFSVDKYNSQNFAILSTYANLIVKICDKLLTETEYVEKLVYEFNTFSITIEQTEEKIIIHNYLGSKKAIPIKKESGVTIKEENLDLILSGFNKEKVGIMISRLTNLRRKSKFALKLDKRKFFDNYYRIKK